MNKNTKLVQMKDGNNMENTSWGNVRVDEIGKNEKWVKANSEVKILLSNLKVTQNTKSSVETTLMQILNQIA